MGAVLLSKNLKREDSTPRAKTLTILSFVVLAKYLLLNFKVKSFQYYTNFALNVEEFSHRVHAIFDMYTL